jgi:hypothetical protein
MSELFGISYNSNNFYGRMSLSELPVPVPSLYFVILLSVDRNWTFPMVFGLTWPHFNSPLFRQWVVVLCKRCTVAAQCLFLAWNNSKWKLCSSLFMQHLPLWSFVCHYQLKPKQSYYTNALKLQIRHVYRKRTPLEWNRDSSVGIATDCWLDDQGEREFESR